MTKKNLSIAAWAIIFSLAAILTARAATGGVGAIETALYTVGCLAIVVLGVFTLSKLISTPKQLRTGQETKPLLRSKTFWGAFIIFVTTVLQEVGVSSTGDPESIRDMILAIDWTQASKAGISLFIIFLRYFDVETAIDGIIDRPTEENQE